jgi:hypothetical protein
MLLAVSFGVIWTGMSLALSGYKQWEFTSLMVGKWGVSKLTNNLNPPIPGAPPSMQPGQPNSPFPGDPNQQPYVPPGTSLTPA